MGHEVLCFLNDYKGYYQILMAPKDMDETVFVTDNGIICYTRIPFRLKNAQVKFQQMVTDVFGDQIGRNMEVYVDDIILMSRNVEMLPQDM